MKTIEEVRDWLLKNRIDSNGNLNLNELDFSNFNGHVLIGFMKVKKDLFQDCQEVRGNVYQCSIEVGEDLFQGNQIVNGDLYQNEQEVNGDLYQGFQQVKGKNKK